MLWTRIVSRLRSLPYTSIAASPFRPSPIPIQSTRSIWVTPVTSASVSAAAATHSERREFQAETKKLLDIVAKSLYSDSEVFVRELISNSCDALEKRRVAEMSCGEGAANSGQITITTDQKDKIITFKDNGIGMNKEELVSYLGTIAHSGSKAFIEDNKEKAEAVIGQFGVGFYSAFMVADRVQLKTRKAGEEKGLVWTWTGDNSYEIADCEDVEEGTTIQLHLRVGDAATFADPEKVKEVIEKYSYFVSAPIMLNGERVNSLNAIWTANPKEVTQEQHDTFFSQLSKMHHPHLVMDRPSYYVHYKADSPMSIRSILYVPSHRVSQMEFASQHDYGLSLYARRVLIKAKAKQLLPKYLRFVVGVVDCEDIPLNLSREMLQNDPVLIKLRRILTEKLLTFFVQQMKKDMIKYSEFYKNYSLFFKEGIVTEADQGIKEDIARLLLFETSNHKSGTLTSLADYISRMQEGQKEVYYMFAPSRQLAESSPYFELVKGEGKERKLNDTSEIEVLFLLDPADELVFLALSQYKGISLVSVEKWAEDKGGEEKTEKTELAERKELFEWVKTTLGSVKVNEVKGSRRVSDHPAMISVQHEMGAARHLLRMGETKGMEHLVFLKPTLHLHLNHPLIEGLIKLKKSDPRTAQLLIEQIYDNALITAGLLSDSRNMVPRLNDLLAKLIGKEKSAILTP